METNVNDYKKVSYFLTALGCVILFAGHIIRSYTEYRSFLFDWSGAAVSMVIPIFCFWIGGLFRVAFPKPKVWVQAILCALMILMYLRLVLWHVSGRMLGNDFQMLSLAITGYLLLPVAESVKSKGWLSLALFLASAFCYGGVFIVSSHFSFQNFGFRDSEWTVLFIRMMRYVPLVMSLLFLMAFSLSEQCQNLSGEKWLKWTAVILAVTAGIFIYPFYWSFRFNRLFLVHPLTVYLVIVIIRIIKQICHRDPWKDVFKII